MTKPVRTLLFVFIGIFFVYGIVYIDVCLRAKESYQEAEKYMNWQQNPAQKAAYFENVYEMGKKELDKEKNRQKISESDYTARLAALGFEKNFNTNESSLKYAYQWYKDTYELFSPPESKWVKAARQKAPEALALWKDELRAKKIPFDDYMFE